MAFQTKDGKKKFGSAYVAKRYDSMHGAEEEQGPKDSASRMQSKPDNAQEEVAEQRDPMKDVDSAEEGKEEQHPMVVQHGPAHTVTIKHDHKNNRHSVESMHQDGHRHLNHHETAGGAHEEGGKLANVSLKTSGEAGDQQGAASEGDNDHMDGFVMPELA